MNNNKPSDDKMPERIWVAPTVGNVGHQGQGGTWYSMTPVGGAIEYIRADTRVSPAVPLDDFITSEAGAIYKEGLERIWKMSDTKMDVPKSKVIATLQGVAHHHLTQGNAANDFYRFDPDATPPAASGALLDQALQDVTDQINWRPITNGFSDEFENGYTRGYEAGVINSRAAILHLQKQSNGALAPTTPLCIDCHHNNLVGQYCAEIVQRGDVQRACGCRCVFGAPDDPDLLPDTVPMIRRRVAEDYASVLDHGAMLADLKTLLERLDLAEAFAKHLMQRRSEASASMPRRWCSVHNREEFKYESLEHEMQVETARAFDAAQRADNKDNPAAQPSPTTDARDKAREISDEYRKQCGYAVLAKQDYLNTLIAAALSSTPTATTPSISAAIAEVERLRDEWKHDYYDPMRATTANEIIEALRALPSEARAVGGELDGGVRRQAIDQAHAEEKEILIYWLLRCYQSGHREGWEVGPSTDETMDGLLSVLANRGFDPNEDEAAKELLKRKPKF